MSDMARIMREEARLRILQALAGEDNESATSSALQRMLELDGINRPRAWVHEELQYLAEMDAVTVMPAGAMLIATLTAKGARHLDRHIAIAGVQRPDRPGA